MKPALRPETPTLLLYLSGLNLQGPLLLIGRRRLAGLPTKKFAEGRGVAKAQLLGDLPNTTVGLSEPVAGFAQHLTGDPFPRRFACGCFHRFAQVFTRDAKPAGVVGYLETLWGVLRHQLLETGH